MSDLTRLEKLELTLSEVKRMRELQRAWFGGDKSRRTLEAARAAEQKVDRMIEKLGEQAPLKELQGRLF